MDVVISHESALAYLDACARKEPALEYSCEPIPYPGGLPYECASSKRDLAQFDLNAFQRPGKDVDVLVPGKAEIRRVKGFRHHSAGGRLPDGALVDAGGGVLVCSAPLLFVQLSEGKSLIECIKLGFFLCGTYSPEPSAPSGTVERHPLAVKDELEKALDEMKHLRGASNAAAAMRWVLDGAASPMEVELALPFFLPPKLGGRYLEKPAMNYPIPLSAKGRRILGKEAVRIDVYWPDQKVGLEYDSKSNHGRLEEHGNDQARALVLRSMGIHIESVTKQQVDDRRQIDILANILRSYGVKRAERLPGVTTK